MIHRVRGGIAAVLAAALLAACASPPAGRGGERADVTVVQPRQACAALQGVAIPAAAIGLPTRGARLTSAVLVPPSAATLHPTNGTVIHALPEHCTVLGEIDPVDAAAPVIKFQLNIPTAWNRKVMQIGGGGLNGSIPSNLAVVAASASPVSAAMPPDVPYPLSRGYAMFGGDSGHQGTGGEWALNPESWLNFGYAGLKKTHDAAFAVIDRLYGQRPQRTYFMGTSQGGREALEVAQRFPEDYDGVMANVPLIGYSAHVIAKTLYATVQTGDAWISPDAAKLIAAEVVRQCDALDGLADGVISHYRACNAIFAADKGAAPYQRLRCADGATPAAAGANCLGDAQIATAIRMRSPTVFGFALANGISTFPAYGTGREHNGWLNITPQPKHPARPNLGQPGTTVQFGILKDPSLNLLDFSIAANRERIVAASEIIDSTNPDLSRFFARGGRMIVKSSASDYAVNPQIMAQYYETVVGRFGQQQVDGHVRYYILPNTGHAGSGESLTTRLPIPHRIDMIGMLTDWVEKGVVPPDAPVLSTMATTPPYAVSATKPMCRYPLHPHYRGGDPAQAASFACVP